MKIIESHENHVKINELHKNHIWKKTNMKITCKIEWIVKITMKINKSHENHVKITELKKRENECENVKWIVRITGWNKWIVKNHKCESKWLLRKSDRKISKSWEPHVKINEWHEKISYEKWFAGENHLKWMNHVRKSHMNTCEVMWGFFCKCVNAVNNLRILLWCLLNAWRFLQIFRVLKQKRHFLYFNTWDPCVYGLVILFHV